MHRYSAALQLIEENKIPNIMLYIEVYDTNNEEEIKMEFKKLNKSIAVDQMYIDIENDPNIKNKIEMLCDIFCKEFKMYLSESNNPRNGNFNKTILKNWLYDINIKDHSIDTIYSNIINYNNKLYNKFKDIESNLMIQKKFKDKLLFIFLKSSQYEFKLHINQAISLK